MKKTREVRFEDCHVGDVFRIDQDSPWYQKVGQYYFKSGDITVSTILTAKVKRIDSRDRSVFTRLYINNTRIEYDWWFFKNSGDDAETISDNLEFLPKRKNNYW